MAVTLPAFRAPDCSHPISSVISVDEGIDFPFLPRRFRSVLNWQSKCSADDAFKWISWAKTKAMGTNGIGLCVVLREAEGNFDETEAENITTVGIHK
ncbi:hypothetical protein C4D60_Mb05t31040 [Musa balbisiana]|uniref:Uncharacterized protein n=1 Tax=Musa balbisiana TaxID=52838 RepID=A0A4S8K081_MUSBA|nr:hypothetical protein C4D60_Mb05t31040 [Musa balbisiana]